MKVIIFFLFGLLPPLALGLSNYFNYLNSYDQKPIQGWHGPLLELKKRLHPQKNYVIGILHKPVNAFLFQNIELFRHSVIGAEKALKSNASGKLGHMQVAWACRLPGEKTVQYGFTGQSGESQNQGPQMLLDHGFGMSLMFANFTDGHLASSENQTQRIIKSNSPEGYGFQWVAFEISPEDCQYGLDYLNSYIRDKAYQNFAFALDPSKFEGGGCTSLGVELLFQFGGLSEDLVDMYKTQLWIPKSYLANPQLESPLPDTMLPGWMNTPEYQERKVNLFNLVFLPNFSLKKNQVPLKLTDTELILYSFKRMVQRAQLHSFRGEFPKNFKLEDRKAYGLKRIRPYQTIQSGASFDYVLVNEKLDPSFEKIHQYISSKKLPAFTVEQLNGTPGVIFSESVW